MESQDNHLYDLFISHSSKDKTFVRDLVDRLDRVGIRCWLDEDAIEAGGSIVSGIFEGIKKSRKVLLVYSKNYFDSVWSRKEYQSALMHDPLNSSRKLLPIMCEQVDVADELRGLKWLDATSAIELEKTVRKLVESVLEKTSTEQVYISYTHDSEEHKKWVAGLHKRLAHDGVEVRFDIEFMRPGRNYWRDIERYVADSTCVLMIGTPQYKLRSTQSGTGLHVEYHQLLDRFNSDPKYRIIPLLRSGIWEYSFPEEVIGNLGIDMRPGNEEIQYPVLLRTLLLPDG